MAGRFSKALALIVLVLLAVVGLRVFVCSTPPRFTSIAVLPVKNASLNPEHSLHLSIGFDLLIGAKLKLLPGLRVIKMGSSEPDVHLNTEALIQGTFSSEGDSVECSVVVLDRSTGERKWGRTVHGQRDELLDLQSSLLLDLAEFVRGSLTKDERDLLLKPPASSFEAYEAFRRGQLATYSNRRESKAEALEYFQKALSLDPRMADAYLGIGAVFNQYHYSGWGDETQTLSEAEQNFNRALELEPGSQRARTGLMRVRWARGQSEEILRLTQEAVIHGRKDVDELLTRAQGYLYAGLIERARPLLEEALRINPGLGEIYFFLHLALMWTGSHEAVLENGEFFAENFGEEGMIVMGMGVAHWYLGNRAQAYDQYENSIELYGEGVPCFVLYEMGRLYEMGGEADAAREAWTRGREALSGRLREHANQPRDRGVLCAILGGLGEREELEKEIARLKSEAPDNGYNLTYAAIGLLGLGEHRRAMDLLIRGFEGGYNLGALDTTRLMMADVPATWLIHLDEFEALRRLDGFAELNARAIERENRLRAFY